MVVTPSGDIVSASLDRTIRVWRGGACVGVLQGHEAAVLCLLLLPNGDLLSGGGDCAIKVWSLGGDGGGKCTHTIAAAHGDSVRCAALRSRFHLLPFAVVICGLLPAQCSAAPATCAPVTPIHPPHTHSP